LAKTIPAEYRDILEKKAFANVATLLPDGSPHVTPVWVDFDGENLLLNTARGRVKEKNLSERKKVAISIQDPENPYRYIGVRGEVIEVTEDGADEHIDKLAKKYIGEDKYPWRAPGEVRVIARIRPDRVNVLG